MANVTFPILPLVFRKIVSCQAGQSGHRAPKPVVVEHVLKIKLSLKRKSMVECVLNSSPLKPATLPVARSIVSKERPIPLGQLRRPARALISPANAQLVRKMVRKSALNLGTERVTFLYNVVDKIVPLHFKPENFHVVVTEIVLENGPLGSVIAQRIPRPPPRPSTFFYQR